MWKEYKKKKWKKAYSMIKVLNNHISPVHRTEAKEIENGFLESPKTPNSLREIIFLTPKFLTYQWGLEYTNCILCRGVRP